MTPADPYPGSPRAGRAARRARSSSSSRPSLLFFVIVLLCVLGFVQAVLLFPHIFGPDKRELPTAADVNLPERTVRIFRAEGTPELLLKQRLDLPEADLLGAGELDRILYPGGERHLYLLLLVGEVSGDDAAIDPHETPPALLLDGGARVEAVDLAAAVRDARDRLPGYLDLSLRSLLPAAGEPRGVAPTWTAALFAFPADGADRIVGAVVGERRLVPEEIVKDDLDLEILRAAVPREEGGK